MRIHNTMYSRTVLFAAYYYGTSHTRHSQTVALCAALALSREYTFYVHRFLSSSLEH